MKTFHQKMKELDKQKLENRLKEIENSKNNFSRMFRVIKEIQRQRPKMPLLIKTKTGEVTINEKEQAEIIAADFKKQFSKNTQVLKKIHSQPTAMNQSFTAEEIKSAIRSVRNDRSAGDDQIIPEMLKSAPDILNELLADIYSNISETGIDTRRNNANTEAWKAKRTSPESLSYHAPIHDKKTLYRIHEEMHF